MLVHFFLCFSPPPWMVWDFWVRVSEFRALVVGFILWLWGQGPKCCESRSEDAHAHDSTGVGW